MDSRRTKKGIGHVLTVPGRMTKNTLGHHHRVPDTRSESSDHDRAKYYHEHVNLENTYKLSPNEDNKFSSNKMERAMKEILEKHLSDIDYNEKMCPSLASNLSSMIKERAKEFPWKRYRYVVQVVLGQNSHQAIQIGSRCIWDDENDNFACASFKSKTVFAVAACYGIYLE